MIIHLYYCPISEIWMTSFLQNILTRNFLCARATQGHLSSTWASPGSIKIRLNSIAVQDSSLCDAKFVGKLIIHTISPQLPSGFNAVHNSTTITQSHQHHHNQVCFIWRLLWIRLSLHLPELNIFDNDEWSKSPRRSLTPPDPLDVQITYLIPFPDAV